jgi:hypothetical protein
MTMIEELISLKYMPLIEQTRLADIITAGITRSPENIRILRDAAVKVEPLLPDFSDSEIIVLWILAYYASDVGTMPNPVSRKQHLARMDDLSRFYGLNSVVALRLSQKGDWIKSWLENELKDVGRSKHRRV